MPMRDEPIEPAFLPADTGGDNVTVAIDISKIRSNPYQPRGRF